MNASTAGPCRAAGPGARTESWSCRFCFHWLHRVPQRHLTSCASSCRGTAKVNTPGNVVEAMERHCAPCLQRNPPATLYCLSHRGQFKAVGRGGSKHEYTRVSLAAMVIRAAGREQPPGTALAPGSSRFPSGIPPGYVSASGRSTARLPRRAPGRGEEGPAALPGTRSAPRRPPHAQPRPRSLRWRAAGLRRPGAGLGVPGGGWHPRCPAQRRGARCKCHQDLAAEPGAFQPHMVGGFRCQKPAN